MNFLFLKNAINACKKYSAGKKLLNCLAKGKLKKKKIDTPISIKEFSENNYLGYSKREGILINNNLLLTKTFLKQIKNFINTSTIRLFINLAEGDLNSAKRHRIQGKMQSVLIPGTNQQKVLLFCDLLTKKYTKEPAYIFIGIGDAMNWNYHGKSKAHKNKFDEKARNRQNYYYPIYSQGLKKYSLI